MLRHATLTLVSLLSLAAVPAAEASVVINYASFAGACGTSLTCVGNAAESGSALRVTPAAFNQRGAGFSTSAITLGSGATFSTSFQFQITKPGGIDPADGLTFVVSKDSSGLGSTGGGLGYAGVGNSVAIEFDTYNNGEVGGSNHVGVDINGVLGNSGVSPYGVSTCNFASGYSGQGCMANGNIWTATINYDGATQLLDVFLQETGYAVQHLISGLSIDLASTLGSSDAFVGFTSGTGSGWANHDILAWRLANDTSLGDPGTGHVPEPAGLALLGAASLAAAAARRRRRR